MQVTDRLELTTDTNDGKGRELARVVVDKGDGTKAVFFVTLTFNGNGKPVLEVIGKRKDGSESSGRAVADFKKLHPATL